MQKEKTEAFLREADGVHCIVHLQEPMTKHTTFRIGGPAEIFAEVQSISALCKLRTFCEKQEIPFFLLGNGSNLLVADGGFDGVVLHLSGDFTACRREENQLIAGAGMKLSTLAAAARDFGLSGLEFAFGIPGSLGGAAFMNAGAYGGELKDVLTRAECLLPEGRLRSFFAAELQMGYRSSILSQNGGIVTAVTVQLHEDEPAAISARMEDFMERRRSKQPLELPSAGSMFKRPAGYYAAALIEQCGLKGFSVGGAQISEKHSGFVVNTGGATCADVLELVRCVQQRVREQTGVELECEVRRLG